jgi:hypothetical protein
VTTLAMTRPLSTGRGVLRQALAISVIVPFALVGLARVRRPAEPAPPPEAATTAPTTDVWAGDSPLPGESRVVDVEVEDRAPGSSLQAPAPAAAPDPAPAPTRARSEPEVDPAPVPAPAPTPVAARRPRPAASSRPRASADAAEARSPKPGASGGAPGGAGGEFGAEGPGGVRDLGRAFTRAIPPASDSDATWAKLPAGDAGSIEISIDVDEAGRIAGWRPNEKDPPRHLVQMVKRTMALLEAGTFAVRSGAVGAGSQVLVLRARLSDVEVPEEHNGGAFNLKWTFEAGRGTASFTQIGGRHVEVTVKVLRVETKG